MVSPSVSQLAALIAGGAPEFAINFLALRNAGLGSAETRSLLGLLPQTPEPAGSIVGDTGQPVSLTTQGAGELNVPFGADFLSPTLGLQGILAQLQEQGRQFDIAQPLQEDILAEQQRQFGLTFGEQGRQFNTSALFNAAQSLASLRAQGPQSAAELAFAQAGLGLPAIGGSAQNIAGLFGAATRGAGGQTTFGAGGQMIDIPNTLGGAQLSQLQGNPNLAGTLQSFAQASGNPDLLSRSLAALLPSGFQGVGSGL